MSYETLDWTSEIPASAFDESDYTLLPPGDYTGTITQVEKDTYEGGPNIGPCNKAIVWVRIEDETTGWTSSIRTNFFLHEKCLGILARLFRSAGLRKSDEALKFRFDDLPGRSVRVRVKHREHEGKQYNEIKRWLDPPEQAAISKYATFQKTQENDDIPF